MSHENNYTSSQRSVVTGEFTSFKNSYTTAIAQNMAMCLPLTHAAIITRALAYGDGIETLIFSIAYIGIMTILTTYIGVKLCLQRIVT